MKAILLQNLSKTYAGGKQALDHVSLELGHGEVFGFLGPNGAGKTTTVKLLNGMLLPSEGNCRVLGIDPAKEPEKVHAFSGIVTEHAQMYDQMTGLENLIFYGNIFGISSGEAKKRAEKLLEQLELANAKDKKLSAYSTGMRQRLSLARALIHRPKILFLDEPTSGLDPESAQNVNQMLRTLASEQGMTLFLCTHQLRYAQEICTRYGHLLASGTLTELRDLVPSGITLEIRGDHMPACSFTKTKKDIYETSIHSEEEIPGLVRKIVEGGGNIYSVIAQKPSLEDIYFTLTSAKKEENL